MKINQYCSVCKKHLDMEVIPTDDGGDDGVIWLRCPECQGFLPKFTGEGLGAETDAVPTAAESSPTTETSETPAPPARRPAADPAAGSAVDGGEESAEGQKTGTAAEPPAEAEPVAEYAARLAEADTSVARPYRPSSSYEVGEVILHLAYDDVGIVVAKEHLPGGRKALKVYFDQAGVVHLIEQAPGGR